MPKTNNVSLITLRPCRYADAAEAPLLDQVLLAVERLGAQVCDDTELVLGQRAADIVVRPAPVVEGLLPTGTSICVSKGISEPSGKITHKISCSAES